MTSEYSNNASSETNTQVREPNDRSRFYLPLTFPGVSGFFHFGHFRGYTYADMFVRYRRRCGDAVLFTAGVHASGNLVQILLRRIERHDPVLLEEFQQHGYTLQEFEHLTSPDRVIRFFQKEYRHRWEMMRIDCDWDRYMTTEDEGYHRFVQWQFRHLIRKGLITEHAHVVPFCPNCQIVAIDSSETDIRKGSNAQRVQALLLFYQLEPALRLLVCTTHPETIFAARRLLIGKGINYVSFYLGPDSEHRYVAAEAAIRALSQQYQIREIVPFDLHQYITQFALDLFQQRSFPLSYGIHIQETIGTGIVISVPDIDLLDHRNEQLEDPTYQFQCRVRIGGERFDPSTPDDLSLWELERRKRQSYERLYSRGSFEPSMGPVAGISVREAIRYVRSEALRRSIALDFWYFTEPVICRCGETVFLRLIENQLFINYADPRYVERSKWGVQKIQTFPPSLRETLRSVIFDWFGERACCRRGSWIGTRFPGHPELIIEPISDSTIFQAYYILSGAINQRRIRVDQITDEMLDSIFLGARTSDPIVRSLREEFNFWYPISMIVCGKEHQTAHIPVCLFTHQVIFEDDQTKQPRSVLIHEHVADREGLKLSKSKGNAVPIPALIEQYGSDVLRMFYVNIAEYSKEIRWNPGDLRGYERRRQAILLLFHQLVEHWGRPTDSGVRAFLNEDFRQQLARFHQAMTNAHLRDASMVPLIELPRDLRWVDQTGGAVQTNDLLRWLWMLEPIAPSLAEELFTHLQRHPLISLELQELHHRLVRMGDLSLVRANDQILNLQSFGTVDGCFFGANLFRTESSESDQGSASFTVPAVQQIFEQKRFQEERLIQEIARLIEEQQQTGIDRASKMTVIVQYPPNFFQNLSWDNQTEKRLTERLEQLFQSPVQLQPRTEGKHLLIRFVADTQSG